MSMAHKSGNSGKVLGGGFEYKIPVKSWNVGLASGGKDGVFTLDDFVPFDAALYVTSGTGITAPAALAGSVSGEVEVANDASSADDNVSLLGGNRSGLGSVKIASGKQSSGAIRFKASNITDGQDLFIGWHDGATAISQVVPVGDDGALSAQDGICLHMAGGTSSLDLKYGPTLAVLHKAAALTLVADQYFNLSFHCDGTDVLFFIDGVQVGDKVTLASVVADGTDLVPCVVVKNSTVPDAITKVTVDSIAGANER